LKKKSQVAVMKIKFVELDSTQTSKVFQILWIILRNDFIAVGREQL
jgi:hypothetical protein